MLFTEAVQFSSALDRLTEHRVPTISKMVSSVRPGQKITRQATNTPPGDSGPIPKDILILILNYLFPDAEGEEPTAPYPSTLSQVPEWEAGDGNVGEHPLKVSRKDNADKLVAFAVNIHVVKSQPTQNGIYYRY